LTDLQIQLLKREAEQRTQRDTADVRVSLEHSGRDYRFVVTNWGLAPAQNVDFKLTVQPGKESPLVRGDYEDRLPIRELLPGDRVTFIAAITFGTGTTFDAVLTWTENGSEKRREMQVSM
jgi:hypothetical protein